VTRWRVVHGDILDVPAEGIVCSANPSLNLSGGVGGAFAMRYGRAIQDHLHGYLREHDLRTIAPGEAVLMPPCGAPYVAVAHAVAIDVFYEARADWIVAAYRGAFEQLASRGCRSIVAACLGCGYGRCAPAEFGSALARLLEGPVIAVEDVAFVTTSDAVVSEVARVLDTIGS